MYIYIQSNLQCKAVECTVIYVFIPTYQHINILTYQHIFFFPLLSFAQCFAQQVKFPKKLMDELLVTKMESVFHLGMMTWFASLQLALNSMQQIKTHCSGTNHNCFFSLCTRQIP